MSSDHHRWGEESGEPQMSDAEIQRVADRVFEKMQAEIGRSAVRVAIWAITVGVLAILAWLGIVKTTHAAQIALHVEALRR